MSGKKQSPTKKTAQEIREMIACLDECLDWLDVLYENSTSTKDRKEVSELAARIDKLVGKPK